MIKLNLLPWRERKKITDRKIMARDIFLSIIFPAVIVYFCYYWFDAQKTQLQDELIILDEKVNLYIEQHKAAAERDGSKENTIQHLIKNKYFFQKLFFEINNFPSLPICYKQIKMEKQKIIFNGLARSTFDFTEFITHWPLAKLFSSIQIEKINQLSQGVEFSFSVETQLEDTSEV